MAGARRFIWNWGLARWKAHYEATGKSISLKQLSAELTASSSSPRRRGSTRSTSQALQQALKDLHQAFVNFFKKRARSSPVQVAERDRARFRIPQRVTVEDEQVYVPKIGWVKIRPEPTHRRPDQERHVPPRGRRPLVRQPHGGIRDARRALPPADPARVVGIDLGLIDFVTLSDDSDPIPAPRFYRKGQVSSVRRKDRLAAQQGQQPQAQGPEQGREGPPENSRQRRDFLHKLDHRACQRF